MHNNNGIIGVEHAGNCAAGPNATGNQLKVAIVGGGIVGCVTALGLLKRGVSVKIYEQARSFREIGAGIAFTTTPQKCMELTNPNVLAAFKAVSTGNEDLVYPFYDGCYTHSDDPNDMRETELFRRDLRGSGFNGCHRAHFLDELVKYIPEGVVEFQKRLDTYVIGGADEDVTLKFEDGTSATADAVIGCDGIRSRVRQILFGKDNPASYPGFCHQVAFRGLVRMDKAVAALGEDKALARCMRLGPQAHVVSFPIAQRTLINVVAFATQDEWPHEKLTTPATRKEVMEVYKDWNPTVRTIVSLLEDSLDKWAIFDNYDHPAPTFSSGSVCIAGDAAHASSPHHGAGAGFGMEDALTLSTVLEEVNATLQTGKTSKSAAFAAAFKAYDATRRERTQWLVESSRKVCEIYEWANPDCESDWGKCLKDVEQRARKIWDFDIDGMLTDARSAYQRLIQV